MCVCKRRREKGRIGGGGGLSESHVAKVLRELDAIDLFAEAPCILVHPLLLEPMCVCVCVCVFACVCVPHTHTHTHTYVRACEHILCARDDDGDLLLFFRTKQS